MNIQTKDALWHFAVTLYRKDSVTADCLWLQDTYQVNINMLLWCIWCGVHELRLTPSQMSEAEAVIDNWHVNVILPLRQTRQYIKVMAKGCAGVCRDKVKEAELLAEQQALEDLAFLSAHWSKGVGSCWRDNVEEYLVKCKVVRSARAQTLRVVSNAILGT